MVIAMVLSSVTLLTGMVSSLLVHAHRAVGVRDPMPEAPKTRLSE
jgi:ABC-type thiamin/hydroxymethylpyrimidine transport system permease subunit